MKATKIVLLVISILFIGMNAQDHFMKNELEKEEGYSVHLVVLKEKSKDSDKITGPKHLNEKPKESKRKLRKELKKEFKNKIGALRLLLALSIILLIFL